MHTRNDIESALDASCLWVHCHNGKKYRARRNGRTQTWKTRPTEFRIPIKWAFRDCGAITHHDLSREAFSIFSIE